MPRQPEGDAPCHKCKIHYPDNYWMKNSEGEMVSWCRECANNDKEFAENPMRKNYSMIAEAEQEGHRIKGYIKFKEQVAKVNQRERKKMCKKNGAKYSAKRGSELW